MPSTVILDSRTVHTVLKNKNLSLSNPTDKTFSFSQNVSASLGPLLPRFGPESAAINRPKPVSVPVADKLISTAGATRTWTQKQTEGEVVRVKKTMSLLQAGVWYTGSHTVKRAVG